MGGGRGGLGWPPTLSIMGDNASVGVGRLDLRRSCNTGERWYSRSSSLFYRSNKGGPKIDFSSSDEKNQPHAYFDWKETINIQGN